MVNGNSVFPLGPKSTVWMPLVVLVCGLMPAAMGQESARQAKTPMERDFQFRYGVQVQDLPVGADVRVWLPMPKSDVHQRVEVQRQDLPADVQIGTDTQYGNQMAYFQQTTTPDSTSIAASMSYHVTRKEVRGLQPGDSVKALSVKERAMYLAPNRFVPISGKPLSLLASRDLPADTLGRARAFYEAVDEHVRYDKSNPGYGNGDVLWVCDSRFGNCTDFHSLFIAMARGNGVPAHFEIGFPLPLERGKGTIGGYHCWANFYDPKLGWVPVDISEADKHPELRDYFFGNLTADRISFTRGRDLTLVPAQKGPLLNYFVDPYVEVNGEVWPREKIQLEVEYQDVPAVASNASLPQVQYLIDTHIHLYDTRREVYELGRAGRVPWPPTNDRVLHNPHLPHEYHRVAKPAGATGAIVVEASPRVDDNDWVLDLVKDDSFFVGLVGNLDPFQASFGNELARLRKDPRFLGIRLHWMNRGSGDADNEILVENLNRLTDAELTLDVLMNGEGPATIREVAKIAQRHPRLRIVANHVLGYNIDGERPGRAWSDAVSALAQQPNVWVKVSGLYQRSQLQPAPHDVSHYESLLEVLWNAFGEDRLIYGSNWPCTKMSGDYTSFVELVNAFFSAKGPEACEKFFWQNAARAYRLHLP